MYTCYKRLIDSRVNHILLQGVFVQQTCILIGLSYHYYTAVRLHPFVHEFNLFKVIGNKFLTLLALEKITMSKGRVFLIEYVNPASMCYAYVDRFRY